MKSLFARAPAITVIGWLRWLAVVGIVYSAPGLGDWLPQPALLAVVHFLVFKLAVIGSRSFLFVAVGAKLAPQARVTTALVLAAARVLLTFWNHVLSRVSLAELVLFQGGNYRNFALEALGAVLGVVYIYQSEKARSSEESRPPDFGGRDDQAHDLAEAVAASTPAKAAPMAMAVGCLRWAAVLALVCSAVGELVYSVLGNVVSSASGMPTQAFRPAPLAVMQMLDSLIDCFASPFFIFVVIGAKIAPRARVTTAIVLAAMIITVAFRGHVLLVGGPWWSWKINYTHFTLDVLRAVAGVGYIYWSEKPAAPAANTPPDTLPT